MLLSLLFCSQFFSSTVFAETPNSWNYTDTYPISAVDQSCVIVNDIATIVCVGGDVSGTSTSAVYYAPVSSSGIGSWVLNTNHYPNPDYGISCAVDQSDDYIYCVGGLSGTLYSDTVGYGLVTASGIASWSTTTVYPSNLYEGKCGIYNSFIYCVAGFNGVAYVNAVYYNSVSSSGVGATWTSTTAYGKSVANLACTISSGYDYCVGGRDGSNTYSNTYYGQLNSLGVVSWTATTAYPNTIAGQACTSQFSYIYCIAGDQSFQSGPLTDAVEYAPISGTGIGTWLSGTNYKAAVYLNQCSPYSGTLFCSQGANASNFTYNALSIPVVTTTLTAFNTPSITDANWIVVTFILLIFWGGASTLLIEMKRTKNILFVSLFTLVIGSIAGVLAGFNGGGIVSFAIPVFYGIPLFLYFMRNRGNDSST